MTSDLKIPALDLEVSGDLQIALKETFDRMFGIKVNFEFSSFDQLKTISSGDIYGSVAIISDHYLGSLTLAFPKETLLWILSKFHKREVTVMEKPAVQMIGELTNIVFGVFKHRLNEKGFGVKMALPSIVMDAVHRIPDAAWLLECKIASTAGPFSVYVARTDQPGQLLK